jgi:hypothetical protein
MRTGIWIPEWINGLGLTGNMKLLYAEIVSLNKNGCFASNQHFADVLGLKPDTISRMVSALKKNGFIIQTSFDGRKRTLVPLRLESSHTESEKVPKENKIVDQGSSGKVSNPVLEFPPKPSTKLQINKKYNKIESTSNINTTWDKFLKFAIKLSGSTFLKLKEYSNPESLPNELRIYYDRFLSAA